LPRDFPLRAPAEVQLSQQPQLKKVSRAPKPIRAIHDSPTEFDILCRDHGGPLPIRQTVTNDTLAFACRQFFFDQTWATFCEWEPDRVKAMRVWPWVALAADCYRFERSEKAQYFDEPKPSEFKRLLLSISNDARSLCDKLATLESLAHRIEDTKTSGRRAHIAWLYELIAQGLNAPKSHLDESPAASVAAHFAMRRFCLALVNVELSASAAASEEMPPGRTRSQVIGVWGIWSPALLRYGSR
jgi:hypothetical protein